jgi:hypothetical protein
MIVTVSKFGNAGLKSEMYKEFFFKSKNIRYKKNIKMLSFVKIYI